MKYLIINADDFGYSKIFNIEILKLIKDGLISSTSVMVNWLNEEQADQIKELAKLTKFHNISVGLHLEFSDTNFKPEIEKQYQKFFHSFGFKPSHIDLHKTIYLKESCPYILQFCQEKNIPCRNHQIIGSIKVRKTQNEVIDGTKISFEELKNILKNFKDGESYEILFHPGSYDQNHQGRLNKEREIDVEKIKKINPLLKQNNIKLISYLEL